MPKVFVHLMGGLGNQMFQYAAGRALAIRNGADLYLDTWSGFVRDRIFRRKYELGVLPVEARCSGALGRVPFWYTRLQEKFGAVQTAPVARHWWGAYIRELSLQYYEEVTAFRSNKPVWIHGHWQYEAYFAEFRHLIANELLPPAPADADTLRVAALIQSNNSIAVGTRFFEEMPGESKEGVGGLTDVAFYEQAAVALAREVPDPLFFVFSTKLTPPVKSIALPGPVHYVTGDNGAHDAIASLWLLSNCRHHIIANSSFFWWGAWLAEYQRPQTRVIASNRFAGGGTVPARWSAS